MTDARVHHACSENPAAEIYRGLEEEDNSEDLKLVKQLIERAFSQREKKGCR